MKRGGALESDCEADVEDTLLSDSKALFRFRDALAGEESGGGLVEVLVEQLREFGETDAAGSGHGDRQPAFPA